MRFWAIPSWAGDFRFEEKDGALLLTVKDPTAGEQEALRRWTKVAEKRGWVTAASAGTLRQGISVEMRLEPDVTLADAAAEMARLLNYKRAGVITAFAFADGQVRVTEALGAEKLPKWARTTAPAEVKPAEAPVKAVTVARPSLSCPECPGPASLEKRNMACEVLWEFLDAEQRKEWLADRAITTFGGLTGHCYRIAARDTEEARGRGRTAFDLDDRVILHNYHLTVPPEEEVLTVKLMLEHRENWLRVHGEVDPMHRARQVFTSPWPFRP